MKEDWSLTERQVVRARLTWTHSEVNLVLCNETPARKLYNYVPVQKEIKQLPLESLHHGARFCHAAEREVHLQDGKCYKSRRCLNFHEAACLEAKEILATTRTVMRFPQKHGLHRQLKQLSHFSKADSCFWRKVATERRLVKRLAPNAVELK
jgi:hypothetical protein